MTLQTQRTTTRTLLALVAGCVLCAATVLASDPAPAATNGTTDALANLFGGAGGSALAVWILISRLQDKVTASDERVQKNHGELLVALQKQTDRLDDLEKRVGKVEDRLEDVDDTVEHLGCVRPGARPRRTSSTTAAGCDLKKKSEGEA